MNEEEKKAIEILKEIEINTYAEGKAIAIDTVLKLIKKLQKENEEFKRLHIQDNKHLDFIMQHCIPVQKVKDKISERQFELQQEYKDFEDDAILIVLQELLEGRE
jgi:hypothetical protein